jgi:hypothetical protein
MSKQDRAEKRRAERIENKNPALAKIKNEIAEQAKGDLIADFEATALRSRNAAFFDVINATAHTLHEDCKFGKVRVERIVDSIKKNYLKIMDGSLTADDTAKLYDKLGIEYTKK